MMWEKGDDGEIVQKFDFINSISQFLNIIVNKIIIF